MINDLAIDNVSNYFASDGCEGDRSVVTWIMPTVHFFLLVQHVPVSMVLAFSLDVVSS